MASIASPLLLRLLSMTAHRCFCQIFLPKNWKFFASTHFGTVLKQLTLSKAIIDQSKDFKQCQESLPSDELFGPAKWQWSETTLILRAVNLVHLIE